MDFQSLKYHFGLLRNVNWIKTLYFNLKYFPLCTAIKLPCFVYWHTCLNTTKGAIKIEGPVSRGMIRLGKKELGVVDNKYSRTVWNVSGVLRVKGNATFGRGTRISIEKNGEMVLGRGFVVMGISSFICRKSIVFGGGCLLSWEILVMDNDAHHILDADSNVVNPPAPIVVGDDVWIGCRNTILKGSHIPSHSVVAAASVLTKNFEEEHTIIGGHGNGQKILKIDIHWSR